VSNQAPPASAAFEDDRATEDDEDKKNQHILSKEDAKAVMKTKEFENFINKASKIVERALVSTADILGPSLFLDNGDASGEGEEAARATQASASQRERLVPLFTFDDAESNKRTVTSIEWSPKVSPARETTY